MRILKYIFLTLFMAMLIKPVISQSWVSSNAVWHYNFEAVGGVKGFHKISYIRDTVILGQQCQYLQVINQTYSPSGPPNWNYVVHEPDTLVPRFTFERNDTVFYYTSEQFSILYYMAAEAGQSWDLGVDTNIWLCGKSIVDVASTGTISLNGENWPMLNVTSRPNASVGLHGRIVGRFGAYDRYLFPIEHNCDSTIAVEFPLFYFNCFSDDDFPLIQTYNYECDNPLAVSINENDLRSNKMNIYPNPASEEVYFRIPSFQTGRRNQIVIYDLFGKEKCRFSIDAEVTTLDISVFPRGIYHVLLLENDLPLASAKLVKK